MGWLRGKISPCHQGWITGTGKLRIGNPSKSADDYFEINGWIREDSCLTYSLPKTHGCTAPDGSIGIPLCNLFLYFIPRSVLDSKMGWTP